MVLWMRTNGGEMAMYGWILKIDFRIRANRSFGFVGERQVKN